MWTTTIHQIGPISKRFDAVGFFPCYEDEGDLSKEEGYHWRYIKFKCKIYDQPDTFSPWTLVDHKSSNNEA